MGEKFQHAFDWLAGGGDGYTPLVHSLRGDAICAAMLTVLTVSLIGAYVQVGMIWRRHERDLGSPLRRQALGRLRRALVLGGVGGYVFLPIAMIWPGWRLYVLLLLLLAWLMWRQAWSQRDVKLLCRQFARSRRTEGERQRQDEARRQSFFLNALGHDLKNPLYGLRLQAQSAEESLRNGSEDDTQRALHLIRQCTREANDLLEDFLELGRLGAGEDSLHISRFDLIELIQTVADGNRPAAEQKNLALTQQLPEMLHVESDRGKLERVLQNLLANAIKYTNAGEVRIRASVAGRAITLEVTDTGPGIPPDQQDRLFDAFFRVQHPDATAQPGHGLGLAIVHQLVAQLDGRVELDSTVGRGSTFRVVLPGGAKPGAPSQTAASA